MELLEQHFDTAFAAPDGIKKLRELILTLAMQGKLVPQDPNDPPASELLKDIETEKKRLVQTGKIKAPKPLPPISAEEIPYELPEGWEWVRFPHCYYGIGNKSNQIQASNYQEQGAYPVVDQGKSFISAYTNEKERLLEIQKPVIVFGDHTKNIKYVDFDFVIGADGVKILCPYSSISPRFLFWLMQSYSLTDRGYARHFGVLNEKLAPLPPLPEQQRIVAKIEQLMARCDELERLRAGQENKRLTVHAAAIQQLLNIAAPEQHQRAKDFLAQHFGELYTVQANVTELRKAILQLAVMGKLVPQDPNDPPASELLKDIETEKKRLVKEGKIKAPKPLPPISAEEIPYELPEGWEWVRIVDLTESIDYGTSEKTGNDPSLIPVYRMGNIINGCLVDEGFKYISPEISDLPRLYLKHHDILFNRTNSYELVGKSAAYFGHDNLATFASYLIRIRLLNKHSHVIYINSAMNAPYFRSTQIEPEIVQQCGQANFNGTKLSLCLIPLPPLPEQHRIVAKIDQLMALCDELEAQIIASKRQQSALLDAVMAQV